MIQNIPTFVALIFALTTAATLCFFIWTIRSSNKEITRKKWKPVLIGLVIWLTLQGILTFTNMYNTNTNSLPPKFLLFAILPTIGTTIWLFATSKGREFIDSLPLKNLTYLNVIRIPVELGLFYLFLYKAVPELMTFEGRNFDIFSGITAPFIAYFAFTKAKLSKRILLIWNSICLGLLINIVVNAFFSAPFPFQKFAFEQPNVAILNFPFSWLPTFIVPIILFGHLSSIRQLLKH
jgi:hypothetical protein